MISDFSVSSTKNEKARDLYPEHELFLGFHRLAERVGFEPTVELPLHMISSHAPSTTQTSLHDD